MLDVRRLRTDLDEVVELLARKNVDPSEPRHAAALDAKVRELTARRDEVRALVNAMSKEVGEAKRAGDEKRAAELAAESRALGNELKDVEVETDEVAAELRDLLLRIPNTADPSAAVGASEDDNVVVREEGFDPTRYGDHQRVPHWEIGTELGILDLERAVKISGAMFAMFRRDGARLVRAMIELGLELNRDAFEEIHPPHLVRSDTMVATGQLPKFTDDSYYVERDDLWAIPTAESSLTSIHRDEILDEADLPVRLMAYTPCYRREAGAAGRDTRGLLRVHQFDKVEILAYCKPDEGPKLHEELTARAERALQVLELPYRVLEICTGDLGQSHARQFDLEVYAPGVDRWLEASSISWFTDYQARRANIRYRPLTGGGTQFVHTLNGSALAVPRVWAALVETYRQPDGSVRIPDALRPYMGGATHIPRVSS